MVSAMDSILYQIDPSLKDRNHHRVLGVISALFAALLLTFIVLAAIGEKIGNWTIFILLLPVLLFAAVSWFVLRFGNDYVLGIRIYRHGIGVYFPLSKSPDRKEKLVLFDDIQRLEVEETVEVPCKIRVVDGIHYESLIIPMIEEMKLLRARIAYLESRI